MDADERQRKLEAGRAKLASYRQRRAKGDGAGAPKKTAKRKGQDVPQNDCSTKDRHLESSPPLSNDTKQDSKINHEETQQSKEPEAQSNGVQMDLSSPQYQSLSLVAELGEEDLSVLTGKEQLKQLQKAVEKRNEIIARLSSNLQHAQASRDQFQKETQSLVGQIQALQRQAQQTSVDFLRIKSQSGAEVPCGQRLKPQPGHSSQDTAHNNEEPTSVEPGGVTLSSRSASLESSNTDSDTEAEALLHRLRTELEEERENHQHVLSLLEEERKGRAEERKEREAQIQDLETQLSQAQTLCHEMRQYKEEKEVLNMEVQELRGRLQEEAENSARRLQSLDEEMRRLKEEHREEVESIGVTGAEEVGVKASKNKQNQARAHSVRGESDVDDEPAEDGLNGSVDRDLLMERYLSSAQPAHSCSNSTNESLEEGSLQDNSANSFELNSDVLADESPLHYVREEPGSPRPGSPQLFTGLLDFAVDSPGNPDAFNSGPQSPSQWFNNSQSPFADQEETGEMCEQSDLEKELLHQQCTELREEMGRVEKEQDVLREEVTKTAEELEEARNRWAQVTEELREALWELEEEKEKGRLCQEQLEDEKEKRKLSEEDVSLKSHKLDNLMNKLRALKDERDIEQETSGGERAMERDTSLLLCSTLPASEPEELLQEVQQEKAVLLSSLHEVKQASEVHARFGNELQAPQVILELEETKAKYKTTSALLDERTKALDDALKELNATLQRVDAVQKQLEEIQGALEETERVKSDLESQLLCLRQNLINLEEAQVHAAQKREEHHRKEEEMDGQMRKMEQAIEEELEQFEELLKTRDEELAEEREKWEVERQEKQEELLGFKHLLEEQRREREEEVKALLEKQLLAVEEVSERFRTSHQGEVDELKERHQEEVSELTNRLETELLEQKASLEEDQRRQISFIKQVTEREHQRTVSELCAKHGEELTKLRTELTSDLRESMEAAHQAELQQALTQQALELDTVRLSLTNLHASQLELSQSNLQREREAALNEVQASLRDKWSQESVVLQARQQFELDRIREQNHIQQERLRELHQRDVEELKHQCETRISQERASMEQHAKDTQALRAEREEAERSQSDLQTSLSQIQSNLIDTQTELVNTQASLSKTQIELSETHASFSQTQTALTEAQEALSQTQGDLRESQARLRESQASSEKEIQRLEGELNQALADRNAADCAVEELVSSHKTVLQEKEKHICHLEEKERQLQQEVSRLQEEQTLLKQSSEQETAQLWAQLESMRTSRQELGELKEQLLARSSRVDDMERLKTEFNEQRRQIREQNETELVSLRRYFEQRLRTAEENHREEIALLQLRLVEGALEESVIKTGDASFTSGGQCEEEKSDMLAEITLKLENHKEEMDMLRLQLEERHSEEQANLRSSMALSYKEELLQVRTDLTDRYYEDLQEFKTRHALELEQLRARLSDSHVRDLTRVRLEAARQVEVEVEQRMWRHSEELQTRMNIIQTLESRLSSLSKQHEKELQRSTQQLKQEFAQELHARLGAAKEEERERVKVELTHRSQGEAQRLREELQEKQETMKADLERGMEEQRRHLERELEEERAKLKSLQAALENDQSPQVLAVKQRLEAQLDNELRKAKSTMSAEVKELVALIQEQCQERLHQAQDRFQEEKAQLEQRLAQKDEVSLGELREKHKAELEQQRTALMKNHSEEMDAVCAKHKAQLGSLNATYREQLAAMAIELDSEHKAELVSLEATLVSKQKVELDRLQAVFLETNQAQLKAQEAELERKHQEEKDELERRMLDNMDTLEATYLKEVQTLRDEMVQLEERHRQELNRHRMERGQEMERQQAEQLSVREELKRKLAQMHMEKFSAMAAELSHVHQAELTAQKETMDSEHCMALDSLKKQVLELEQQHGTALQELSQTCTAEKDQHQLQLQELRGISARELEACRRELEEEYSRQRLHFLEEMELLKVQSEERLQDRLNQLKAEFEEQKEAALEKQRRSFTTEHEHKERSYTDKMSQLTDQLQQLDAVVAQLRAEVDCLQGELEGKRAEMETLGTLLQRRERESQEGGNLLKMLTGDLQTAKEEGRLLHQANETLRKVLIEVVRSTVATEDLIGQKINVGAKKSEQSTNQKDSSGNMEKQESGISVTDMTSEDLELTHLLCESLLVSETQIQPGGEEAVLSACSRLRNTVNTLLDLLNHSNSQLEQTRDVHVSLEERFSQGREDSAQLLQQHKLLLEQLDQEAQQKSGLQLNLHKAEGLLDGYVAEKAALEEVLQQKEAQEERLVEELEGLRAKVHQMEGLSAEMDILRTQHQELSEEHAIFLRQRDHLTADLGEREKGLLAEAERLVHERLDLQRQAEKDRSSLSQRLKALETELEEQETKVLEMELHHKANTEDLSQQVQALEKQIKHNRQFIDEQAVEREHERDEFQQEICRLEAQLSQTAKGHSAGDSKGKRIEDLVLQVENLQAVIKDKTEDHASLLAVNQQAQRDIVERNEEIDKLAGRIRELEQALLSTSETNRSITQLQQDLHRMKLREEELTQDNQALEQLQLTNRLQISALQSKLDETKHRYQDNTPDPTQQLRDALDTAQHNLQGKEQEVEDLLSQLEEVQSDLSIKEAELKHLTLQLEMLTNRNEAHVCQLQEQIAALKENVSSLTILQEEREEKEETEEREEESLPSALLQEKNEEIDNLNQEIYRLQQELESGGDNMALEAELEDLRSQVEHLHCDITRLRQDKQEEMERLHEVISTLQAELATLGPMVHEVSDSQDGDSVGASPSPSPEPFYHQGSEWKGRPRSLKQELRQTRSTSSPSVRPHLEALQSQLETAVAEKDVLERLLLTQEEEYRGHGEELAKRLRGEREKAEELRVVLALKEAELTALRANAGQLEEEGAERKMLEEEMERWEAQAQEMSILRGEKAQLDTLVLELQRDKMETVREMESLKTREGDLEREIDALRETSLTLERQVQEARADMVAMETLAAEQKVQIKTLETVKGELFEEREALRRREGKLQEEIERLRQEVVSNTVRIQELSFQLKERGEEHEGAQTEVLTNTEVTLAKADAALRQREVELARLGVEQQALRAELAAVKEGLSTSTERAEKLLEEGQTKDRALVELETNNQRLKAELRGLQEDLAVQEEELAYQQRELQHLRQRCHQPEILPHNEEYSRKDHSERRFEDRVCVSRDEGSLSSPDVLRRHSTDRLHERFHSSFSLQASHLSELNTSDLHLPHTKPSPSGRMDVLHSRTITPEPATLSTHSPGSVSASDNLSMINSLDTDKMHDSETMDPTAPPSPLGSTSSMSAPEWASDGYGSNVSSELGVRLRAELEQTERLDAQFVEYLRCRGMNPTANTDSAAGSMSYSDDLLSPELQVLLKKVYQEGCRILALSQHRGMASSQPHFSNSKTMSLDQTDQTPSAPPMSWQHEKRALQETVVALRELLCRMAQRDTQTVCRGGEDLQREDVPCQSQLRAEVDDNQKRLNTAHNTRQQEQKNRIQSRSLAVEEGEEALKWELTKSQEIQQQLEQEKTIANRRERGEEQREAVQVSFEQQGSEVILLKGQLEQEKAASSNFRNELQAIQASFEKQGSEVVVLKGHLEQEKMACSNFRNELQALRVSFEKQDSEVIALKGHLEQEMVACSNLRKELQVVRVSFEQQCSEVIAIKGHLEQEMVACSNLRKELQVVRVSFEQQCSEVIAIKGQLEQEKVSCSNLRRELQIEHSRSQLLEKRLDDTCKELEDERQRSAQQRDLQSNERSRLERLLNDAESRLTDAHSQFADTHRKKEEEREHSSKQLEELMCRQEADAARDRKFISDMRSQLEQERTQGEELAAMTDRLRAELLQSRRRGEEEDRKRREESQKEQEATARLRVAVETLKEQKQEAGRALEAERQRVRLQGTELTELKDKLQQLKDKEREREEQREKERRKERQEQVERERRQEKMNNRLCEVELLRQQDQQRMRELQQTLAELERSEREMATERLSRSTTAQRLTRSNLCLQNSQTDTAQASSTVQSSASTLPSSGLVKRLLKENSELTERVTTLSQERVTLKHKLSHLERQLRRTENELAKVTAETENRPINDAVTFSQVKVQRLYERYVRAESFRKSLVYQKRYLLLLLGGFQECENATLCLIATMGVRPSSSLTSQRRPITRFRGAVRAVIAISRMKFLTRKWQKAMQRLSGSGIVNDHSSGSRTEVLRQQHPQQSNSSPPSRDSNPTCRETVSTLVPPMKSPFRLHNRANSSSTIASGQSGGTSQDPERSLTEYIHHLEKVQQRLVGTQPGSVPLPHPKKSDR